MKLVKEKHEFGLYIYLVNDERNYLAITYGGNGDLYWSIHNNNEDNNHKTFLITKENYELYKLFDKLYYDINNIKIFDDVIINEEEKVKYKEYNHSNYNELFDESNKTITWYSDETAREVSNYLKIKKEKEFYKLDFYTQPYIDGYDEDFHSVNYIPIRFRNSGSRYDPFNIVFMKMYNDLKKVDDVNEYGHQIHMEEYLYNKKLIKKKEK